MDFRWDYVNPAASRLLRRGPAELIGRRLFQVLPESRKKRELFEASVRAIETGEAFEQELYYEGDGIRGWFRNVTVKLGDSIAVYFSEISARKKLEEELERLVAERTRSLEATTEELKDFCSTIAHDLKAPLRAQIGFANLLLAERAEALGKTGCDWAHRIIEAAEKQAGLIEGLIVHASIAVAEQPLEEVDVAEAIEAVLADLAAKIKRKRASVEWNQATGKVRANPGSLHLAIQNLVSNSLKFVAPRVRPKIIVRTEVRSEPRKLLRLCVKDNGIGIDMCRADKIWEVFQRLPGRYPGVGIGLALVKRAVERMEGRVGFTSQPGNGSCFWIELPPVEPAPGKQRGPGTEGSARRATQSAGRSLKPASRPR